ncbi:Hypothetical protein D9617_2g055960 [Elsinoe fawcettii]|nr:Hypothetical protein D9617_2g055960 [Elsinoe fawcettii]
MDSIKNYFKGGKPSETLARDKQRQRQRQSMAYRQSHLVNVPFTIEEVDDPESRRQSRRESTRRESTRDTMAFPTTRESRVQSMMLPNPESRAQSMRGSNVLSKYPSFFAGLTNNDFSLNRFSFDTTGTRQSTYEDIEASRESYRQSMSSYVRPKTQLFTNLVPHQELTESDEDADEKAVSVQESQEEEDESVLAGLRHEIMVNYLFQQQCARLWIADGTGDVEGVILKKSRGQYLACPPPLADSMFADMCVELNVQCAMTVNSRIIKTFLAWSPDAQDVPLNNGLRVQILPSLEQLPQAKKNQFAAFIADEALLVVWDDDARNLVARAAFIEKDLMELVWSSGMDATQQDEGAEVTKGPGVVEARYDAVTGEELPEDRKSNLLNAMLVGCTIVLVSLLISLGWRQVALEIAIDGYWGRVCFIILGPVQIFITLFFAQVVVGSTSQIIGPITQVTSNSKFYSALLPRRLTALKGPLPHLTIQCPVYKEGLESVIAPTVRSLKAAMSTYELQGGSCNMLFFDDGLQIIDEEARAARINFYTDNNIGWTARPGHGADGYYRAGKFKKASNMNFGLNISILVEEKLLKIERHPFWTQEDEAKAYGDCLQEVLDQNERAWADGNIRIGDYVLIIDSDTRVPTDCLLDAVSEMEQCPDVSILQFSSGVMQITWSFFENGITFFTNLIYSSIKYTVANGDVAPFVGHNAILRWSSLQSISFQGLDGDGKQEVEKFWAENTVSEDFDMALRLQSEGYIVRLAAWAGEGFQEGVSLTVYDELARWEKYAYGCNELLFHPVKDWPRHGLFTTLFKDFILGKIRLTSKITICAYIGTYYAIGSVWFLTIVNYFAIGWYNGYLDKFYLDSWKVWFGLVIVFVLYGNLALAVMRYRIGERTFFGSLAENLKWILLFLVFLGGLSIHVSQALLSHMFSIDMSWGSTNKEAAFSNAIIELEMIWKGYKMTIFVSLLCIVAMLILATANFVPYDWRITSFLAWWPMLNCWGAHLLLPFVLNPALMTFSF